MNDKLPASRLWEPAFRHAFNSILITDADFADDGPHILAANPAFCAMTGYDEDELIGRNPRMLQGPATDPTVIDRLREAIQDGAYFFGSTVNYRKDGSPYNVEWNISAVREEGRVVAFVSVQQDITARIAAQREHDLFLALGNLMPMPMIVTDANFRIVFANLEFERITGFTMGDLAGRSPEVLYASSDAAKLMESAVSELTREHEVHRRVALRRKSGAPVIVNQRITQVGVAERRMQVSTYSDVSDLVESEQRWRSMAHTDALTGAMNRRGGDRLLAELVQRSARAGTDLAAMMCDIDHFKRVNDTHGHAAGDRVLASVARALRTTLRDGDVVVRHGGEEFLVLVPGANVDVATRLAERLRSVVSAVPDDEVGRVTVSIGVAVLDEAEAPEALLARADAALYAAKQRGRDCVVVAASSTQ